MLSLMHARRRPSGLYQQALDELRHPLQHASQRPWASGGVIAFIALAIILYWMGPEIRRYLRIERM